MANFERCLFEILAKLGVAELTALCNFINVKIDLLQNELDKALAFTNSHEDELNEVEGLVRAGEALFQDFTQRSSLLTIAQGLSPNCGDIGNVFGGLTDAAGVLQSGVNDALYVTRQIGTLNGLIQLAKDDSANAISLLRDLCNIVQLVVLEHSTNFQDFITGKVKDISQIVPAGAPKVVKP